MNINRGNPSSYEVLVDSWPDFKAVLVRPRKEVGAVRCSVGTGRCGTGKRFRGFLFSDLASNQWHWLEVCERGHGTFPLLGLPGWDGGSTRLGAWGNYFSSLEFCSQ